jgi:hypothetical protein
MLALCQLMSLSAVKVEIALDMLHDCLSNGAVRSGRHFRDELAKEGLSFPDAWHVLRTGCIYNPPEHDIRQGEWKYSIEGHTPDGIWLVVVFSFKEVDRAFLITVFSVETRRRAE